MDIEAAVENEDAMVSDEGDLGQRKTSELKANSY